MSCCGQKRRAWREQRTEPSEAAPAPPVLQNPATLHHPGKTSLVMKGAVTGYAYLFGPDSSLSVDGRDVPALRATNHFR